MKKLFFFIILVAAAAAFSARREPSRSDVELAATRLWQEADSGSAAALFNLAAIYDRGLLPARIDSLTGDTLTAFSLYGKAAGKGYIPAVSHFGYLLVKDAQAKADIDSGMRLIEKAAIAGDPKAANNLGYFLSQGEYVAKDYEKALFWLKRAADAGLPTGQAQLADLYRQGLGTAPDTLAATALYEKAIHSGLADAQRKLIAMNARGWQSLPADSALTLARRYYRDGAYTPAVILLENILDRPSNVDTHTAESDNMDRPRPAVEPTSAGNMERPRPAVGRSKADNEAAAAALLGDAYSRGLGVPYSYEKAIEYFYKAARLGNAPAQFIIAETLDVYPDALDAWSPKSEERVAAYWYDLAAKSGITDAATASRLLLSD